MSASDDYLDQLAQMVEEARRKEAIRSYDASHQGSSDNEAVELPDEDELMEELANRESPSYYAPGEMLEGQARQELELPEDWENSGRALAIKRGRHEALIEGVYSAEIDGPLEDGKKFNPKLFFAIAMIVVLLSIPIIFILARQNVATAPTEASPLQGAFEVKYQNELARKFPSRATLGENIAFEGLSNRLANTSLKLPEEFSPSQDSCKNGYLKANQPCFLGKTNGNFGVYYIHDAVHANLFAQLGELTPVQVENSKYSAVVLTEFAGESTRMLLLILENNSAFFIEAPEAISSQALKEYGEKLSIVKDKA